MLLWNCDAARAVWSESPRAMQKCAVEANDFSLIFDHLCDRLSVDDLELAAVIAHRIWLRRNQWVFENSFLPPKCLLIGAADSFCSSGWQTLFLLAPPRRILLPYLVGNLPMPIP